MCVGEYYVMTLILPFELRVLITETPNHYTSALSNLKRRACDPKRKENVNLSQYAMFCLCTRDVDIRTGVKTATPPLILVTE